ncbi:MAG TPA: ABC transporter ATP-binding protein [Egibacteraceae bacterium]|nr:ABC transporter ATP-binding protein [Egibacteraceae bacterium]
MSVSFGQYGDLLRRYLAPDLGKALLLGVLLLANVGFQLLGPQILRSFIDGAAAGAPGDALTITALLFLGVALAHQGLGVAAAYVGEDVGWRSTNRLRADLASHCLRLDMPFHNARTPGEMIERIDGDVTALALFFSQIVMRIVGSLLLLIGAVVLLFREDWRIGVAMLLFAIVAITLLARFRELAVPHLRDEREASAGVFGFVEERLAGLDDIRSRGAGRYVMRGLYGVMRRLFHQARRAWMMGSLVEALVVGLFAMAYVMALGLGGNLFLAGAITLGTAFLFFQYTDMLRTPIEQLTHEVRQLQTATAGIVRIGELLRIEPKILDGPIERLPEGPLGVAFEAVSFRYAADTPVLEDVSFALEPGRVLGLLGRTGSGKTTISRLLFRLYEPTAGVVRVGGADLGQVRVEGLRRRIAMVTQEVQLFDASVRDNLTFFYRAIDDDKLRAVLEDLGLTSWLAQLPDGLDTRLRGGGAALSAGEAQLLAVARAFLADPGLIVLDEPSSRLDPATERLIEGAMGRLLAGRTAIVIAHRLQTVERADDILILEDGRMREWGRRADLAARPESRFAELLRVGLEEVLA